MLVPKTMEKGLSELKLDSENYRFREDRASFRCGECKEAFQKPLLATFSSGGHVQMYYACPHCLSKVDDIKRPKKEESKETSISIGNVRKAVVQREEGVECKHFLGYLRQRPKDTPFPDECLTCDKMIDCLR